MRSLRPEMLEDLFPDGVAARADLVALGISHASISRRCRGNGPWQRPIPGVIVFTNREPTARQLFRAALTHAGPDAMLTGVHAARLHGVRNLPAEPRVHTLIPHKSKVATWGFAIAERTIHLPDAVDVGGLPVAPLARALIDASRRMDNLTSVRAMIADAVYRGLCDPLDLRKELAQASTIGSALPRLVIQEVSNGVHDAAERWLREVLEKSGLPQPDWDVVLENESGEVLGSVQAWWPAVGLAVQLDMTEVAVHSTGEDKDSPPTGEGLLLVRLHPFTLRDQPLSVIRELRAAYQSAAQRPPPRISARRPRSAA
ncbi:hypothetical protein [Amycolatopsis sp. NPDC059021]|uniref:hypothetical protein n=1 Tax=Amycolatopsis sp. NPDC059021 TaxID=3346704 RepID=UPI003670690A